MQHLIFLSFQYRKYSNCYIIALQYFLKYGSAIIQQLLHLIFLFLQVEHIAIAILLHCNILIILQCNNIAIAIFSLSSFKLQFYPFLFRVKISAFIQGVTQKYLVLDVIISLKVFTLLSIFNKITNLISVQGVPHKIALCFLTQAGLTVDILSWWKKEIWKGCETRVFNVDLT